MRSAITESSLGVEEAWEGVHVSGTEDSAYYYSTYNAVEIRIAVNSQTSRKS